MRDLWNDGLQTYLPGSGKMFPGVTFLFPKRINNKTNLMKTIIFALVTFTLLMSCEEETPQPVNPFAGSWSFSSPEIQITFDVIQDGAILNYTNRRVIHPAIPENEQTNNQMTTFDKFENGYGMIQINSRGPVDYKITMIYNRFTNEGMAVYDLQIDIPSEPFIVLQDQVFVKAN